MISRKNLDYSMRCVSIIIAIIIFILSSKSKLPTPKVNLFIGFDKIAHAAAFGTLAFAGTFWFSIEHWKKNFFFMR